MNWPLFIAVCLIIFSGGTRQGCALGAAIGEQAGWAFARRHLAGEAASSRTWTAEEQGRWDDLMLQIDMLDRRIAGVYRYSGIGRGSIYVQQLRDQRLAAWQEAKAMAERL